jgi:hypothetical protein
MVNSPKWKRVPIDIGKFQNILASQTGVHWYDKYGEIPTTGYQWRNYLIVQKQEHPKGWFIFIEDETMVKDGSFDGLDVPLNRNMFIPAGQKWSRLEEVNALFITLGKKSPKWEETRKISPRWGEWTVAYNVLLHGKKQGYGGRNARKGTFYGERDRGFKTLNIAKDLCYMIEEIKIAKMTSKCLLNHKPFIVNHDYKGKWVFMHDIKVKLRPLLKD